MRESEFKEGFEKLASSIGGFIRGNDDAVRHALVCLFAEGHLLIEGPPGVAKTSLAKAVAASIHDADQKRIQFTPDLLPSDVTGSRIFRQDLSTFLFEEGPVFTNILIADEINRASPRTQSALLEVMAERQVTVDGQTHPVAAPFMCIATQNPLDYRGTFPLPEAQIDRFMMKVTMRPPGLEAELEVLDGGLSRRTPEKAVRPEMNLKQVMDMIAWVPEVYVDNKIRMYILRIVAQTRLGRYDIAQGASTRAAIALALAVQTHAASQGRNWVSPEDVKDMARPVLRHRLVLTRAATDRGLKADAVIASLLDEIDSPRLGT